MQRLFIIIGILFVVIGIAWPWIKKLNLGNLPGDIIIKKTRFFFLFSIDDLHYYQCSCQFIVLVF